MPTRIERIAVALPQSILTNEELAEDFAGWSAAKIEKKLGIAQRHVLGADETPSDIAVAAAERLFAETGEPREEIDYLVYCTQSPDYQLPTTSCILQDRLGLARTIGAVDINQGCSGYVHGLALAQALIEAGTARKVLLLTADAYSKLVAKDDPSVRTIFGDGATATLLSASQELRIGPFAFGTDGSGYDKLIVRGSGMRDGRRLAEPLYMDGPEVLNFTLREVGPLMDRLLDGAGLTLEQIDFVIFHQANSFILSQLQRKLAIPAEKFIVDFADVGNTVSSTIPIAMSRAVEQKRLERGHKGVLIGFGVGLSWAGCIIDF